MELLQIFSSDQGNGIWISTALLQKKNSYEGNEGAGIFFDVISVHGKDKDEAQTKLIDKLKEQRIPLSEAFLQNHGRL